MKIIGILNFTPDSFSDGGKYFKNDDALLKAEEMILDGADIIDFGAESTNPLIEKALSFEEEFDRVKDILPEIIKLVKKSGKLFSMDTYKYKIAEFAIKHGADIINDQSGCKDKNMISLISESKKKIIIMHSICLPVRRNITIPEDKDPILEVHNWAKNKLEELLSFNILKQNVIFDPGIGFGKTHPQSLKLIEKITAFKDLGIEICVGHSRKGCMRELGDADKATIETSIYLSDKVDYLRVHDVKTHCEKIKNINFDVVN